MKYLTGKTLRCFYVAVFGLACGSPLFAETNGELIDKIEDDTDRWIDLQGALAKENARWKSEKALLENSIKILNTEKSIIEKSLESNRLASELYVNNEASLRKRTAEQEQALEVAGNALSEYQEKVNTIIGRLPDPIRGEVESLALKLSPNGDEQPASVAGRMQSLISILTMIDQFNNSLTLTHQIREGSNGDAFDTRVLYWGLSIGFAVDARGELAWRLVPDTDGWLWEDASDEAASIKELLDVYEKDRRPSLVSLQAVLK